MKKYIELTVAFDKVKGGVPNAPKLTLEDYLKEVDGVKSIELLGRGQYASVKVLKSEAERVIAELNRLCIISEESQAAPHPMRLG